MLETMMGRVVFVVALLLFICRCSVGSQYNTTNSTRVNGTDTNSKFPFLDQIQRNKGMLLRTLYVLIGVTSIVIIYFVIKAIRLRRRRSKSKKYGIITSPASDLEMAPLDQGDDDDEDMTVFELNGKPK